MTVIGRCTQRPLVAAGSEAGGGRTTPRTQGFLQSLTHSLDLACRGYLCAPLIDCDPLTDPECGPAGKKLLEPEVHPELARALKAGEISPGEIASLKSGGQA
jgi:hypothetical protein